MLAGFHFSTYREATERTVRRERDTSSSLPAL
jgi:hypothetical protein